MPTCTCRYCDKPVWMVNRASSRVHDECKRAANKCRYCNKQVDPPKRVHPDCRVTASKYAREEAAIAAKKCGKCKKVKPPSAYSDDVTRFDGKYPYCISCQGQYTFDNKIQKSTDPLTGSSCPLCDTPLRGRPNRKFCSNKCKDRVKALRENFGLTVEQFRKMVDATKGRCPLCNCICKAWQVDHDHSTGKVTGVVCLPCNVGILAASRHLSSRAWALVGYLASTPASRIGIDVTVPVNAERKPAQIHNMWERRKTG